MKDVSKMAAQGDVLFRRVATLPKGAQEVERKPGSPLVVAHSETGHHHIVRDPAARFFTTADPFVCFLQLEAPVEVEHMRPFDTHETLRLLSDPKKGTTTYEVRRQREHTPEGMRMVMD